MRPASQQSSPIRKTILLAVPKSRKTRSRRRLLPPNAVEQPGVKQPKKRSASTGKTLRQEPTLSCGRALCTGYTRTARYWRDTYACTTRQPLKMVARIKTFSGTHHQLFIWLGHGVLQLLSMPRGIACLAV